MREFGKPRVFHSIPDDPQMSAAAQTGISELSPSDRLILRDFNSRDSEHIARLQEMKKVMIKNLFYLAEQCNNLPNFSNNLENLQSEVRKLLTYVGHELSHFGDKCYSTGDDELGDIFYYIYVVGGMVGRQLEPELARMV